MGWTNEDSAIATSQGWDLFEVDGVYDIERDDEKDIFKDDYNARVFVLMRANRCDTARKALSLHGQSVVIAEDAFGVTAAFPAYEFADESNGAADGDPFIELEG